MLKEFKAFIMKSLQRRTALHCRVVANPFISSFASNSIKESALRNYTMQSDLMVGEGVYISTPIIAKQATNQSAKKDTILRSWFGECDVVLNSNRAGTPTGTDQLGTCVYNDSVGISVPIQTRRTFVMSNFNHELVVLISFVTRWTDWAARYLMPTPAYAVASFAGPIGLSSRESSTALAYVLNMVAPNMKGDGNRQHVGVGHRGKTGSPSLTVVSDAGTRAKRRSAGEKISEPRDRTNDRRNGQLWLDAVTAGYVTDLAGAVEANGVSELIRRALRAREDFHLDDAEAEELDGTISALKANRDGETRLNITLPPSSWERVERMKEATGKTFRTLVYEAILVFAELHERSKDGGDEGGRVFLY